MPRRQPKRNRTQPVLLRSATGRVESGPQGGEDFIVRQIPGARATKTYRCPSCDHEIRPGVAHVVAWPADSIGGAEDRRHWHTGCWAGRQTRGLTRRWS
ncbi:ATP/GTP-binding protein [Antrihabitans stalactiti]|uniref:ATP/GTP-binding protein n=1 Tax=Antrihabitans stalactiti TaxID=2584121 RepID=UPI0030B8303D